MVTVIIWSFRTGFTFSTRLCARTQEKPSDAPSFLMPTKKKPSDAPDFLTHPGGHKKPHSFIITMHADRLQPFYVSVLIGLCFTLGSCFFWPPHLPVGLWLFVIGFVLTIWVEAHSLYRTCSKSSGGRLKAAACVLNMMGAIVFGVGCVLFLPSVHRGQQGGWCFVLGSLGFVAGALLHLVSSSRLHYSNLCYLSGSMLYETGSVPYVFDFESPSDRDMVYKYAALQFIVGSLMFLLGACLQLLFQRKSKENALHAASSSSTLS